MVTWFWVHFSKLDTTFTTEITKLHTFPTHSGWNRLLNIKIHPQRYSSRRWRNHQSKLMRIKSLLTRFIMRNNVWINKKVTLLYRIIFHFTSQLIVTAGSIEQEALEMNQWISAMVQVQWDQPVEALGWMPQGGLQGFQNIWFVVQVDHRHTERNMLLQEVWIP